MVRRVVTAEPHAVGPGRLKVFPGAAPGVGRTYRMLDEARRRAGRGTDAVMAFAECHQRAATGATAGTLVAQDTPGGGLTIVSSLPAAAPQEVPAR